MPSQLAYLKLSWCSGASYAPALYEPDWRSGKAVVIRITKADGRPMGIAGLCSVWKSPEGRAQLRHADGQCHGAGLGASAFAFGYRRNI